MIKWMSFPESGNQRSIGGCNLSRLYTFPNLETNAPSEDATWAVCIPGAPVPGGYFDFPVLWCTVCETILLLDSVNSVWSTWGSNSFAKKNEASSFGKLTCTKRALIEVSCSWFKELQRLMCKSKINWRWEQKLLRTFKHAPLIQMLLFIDD